MQLDKYYYQQLKVSTSQKYFIFKQQTKHLSPTEYQKQFAVSKISEEHNGLSNSDERQNIPTNEPVEVRNIETGTSSQTDIFMEELSVLFEQLQIKNSLIDSLQRRIVSMDMDEKRNSA